jgi:hypothetical protein
MKFLIAPSLRIEIISFRHPDGGKILSEVQSSNGRFSRRSNAHPDKRRYVGSENES